VRHLMRKMGIKVIYRAPRCGQRRERRMKLAV
jgi:hypothetical protein